MFSWPALVIFLQIVVIDISLAGDNAVVVGAAAAGLPADQRRKAMLTGIAAATLLRIICAVFAIQLLHVTGLMLAGGLVLLWVAWKMFRDLHRARRAAAKPPAKKMADAILRIIIADISMSLDNVLAVAGAARDHPGLLALGLLLSVALTGAAAAIIARLAARHPWLNYIGFAVVLYTALRMMWDGGVQLT